MVETDLVWSPGYTGGLAWALAKTNRSTFSFDSPSSLSPKYPAETTYLFTTKSLFDKYFQQQIDAIFFLHQGKISLKLLS